MNIPINYLQKNGVKYSINSDNMTIFSTNVRSELKKLSIKTNTDN